MADLVPLKHFCQSMLHETVNFRIEKRYLELKLVGPGTREWIGTNRDRLVAGTLLQLKRHATEEGLRGFLGMTPRRHLEEVNKVRQAIKLLKKMGSGHGHGFGSAFGRLHDSVNEVESILLKLGY